MPCVYLVMERTFDYNDEIYYSSDSESLYNPQKIFLDREAAQNYARKLNVRQFAGMHPRDFAYTPEEISPFSEHELLSRLRTILGETGEDIECWEDLSIPQAISDEQCQQVAALFHFERYSVIEAQMDTEELRRQLTTIIGKEVAHCPQMRAYTLPSRLSIEELRYLAKQFDLGWFSLDGDAFLAITD